MANRFLLVPQDIYRGLLNTDPESITLEHEKKEVAKTKKLRRKPPSTKNTLYNQELRKLLKFNREIKDKPIKVELSNGLKLLTKQPPQTITPQTPRTQQRTPQIPQQTPLQQPLVFNGGTGDEDDDDLLFEETRTRFPSKSSLA